MKKTMTVQEILETGLKDKTPKAVGALEATGDYQGPIGATCALGALNKALGLEQEYLLAGSLGRSVKLTREQIEKMDRRLRGSMLCFSDDLVGVDEVIMTFNDDTNARKKTIFQKVIGALTPKQLATKIRLPA
jgi:hypothetical protein